MALSRRLQAFVLGAATSFAAPLAAQSLEAGYAGIATSHEMMPRAHGPALQLVTGRADARLRWILGVERVNGSHDRVGVPCGGFVGPDADCTPTEIHDDARLTVGSFGPRVGILRRTRFDLAGFVLVRGGVVRSASRWTAYDAWFESKVGGGDVGVCTSWQPFARVPIAATASLSTGKLVSLTPRAEDAWEPFARGLRFTRAQVGLTWR